MPTPTDSKTTDDEYIAQLLAKDAQDFSLRHSTTGIYGTTSRRPTSGAPKPNTRFLKHILRATDTHNANLKRKEEEEARERMRQLRRAKTSSGEERTRDRHDGRERESKRRRVESSGDRERDCRKRRSHRSGEHKSETSGRSSRHKEDRSSRSRRNAEESDYEDRKRSRRHHRDREDSDYERRKMHHRSSRLNETDYRHDQHDNDHYDRRRRVPDLPSHHEPDKGSHEMSTKRHRSSTTSPSNSTQIHGADRIDAQSIQSSDSDPLSNLIGPLPPSEADLHTPPVLPRGRGAHRAHLSTIDSHFAEGYDPALDVRLDDQEEGPITSKSTRRPVPDMATEDDNWDMALEALRDRAAWKRKGAERLREAGFDNTVVGKWDSEKVFDGLDDGHVSNVKWARNGEGREWDRGKVIDENGHVDIRPSWEG